MSTTPPPAWGLLTQWARRRWLQLLAAGGAATATGGLAWWWRSRSAAPMSLAALEQAMLERCIDILVPQDDTPGALELGVHKLVQQVMVDNTAMALSCSALFQALDRNARVQHAGQAFLSLGAEEQDRQLHAVAEGGPQGQGWRGLMQLRELSLQLYYAQPQTWPALGLSGPPQPVGFMDYAEAPRPRGG